MKRCCASQHDVNLQSVSGSALITLLFFATIISFAAANIVGIARNQIHLSQLLVDRTRAGQVAEGAASKALSFIAEDPRVLLDPPPEVTAGTIGNGTYQVGIELGESNLFTIVASGHVGNQARTVRVHARRPDFLAGMNNAMFSNGELHILGNGSVVGGGDVHANQDVDMGGRTLIANGNASAVGLVTVRGAATVDGQLRPGAPMIRFPRVNLDHYYQIAQDNNQVHIGNLHLSSTTRAPAGGVLWVVGDVHFSSHVNFEGLLVATGDIHQAGHFNHQQVGSLPAMISRDGNISLSGQSVLSGLIYASSGRVSLTGSTELAGIIVSWGDIRASGSWGVIEFVEQDTEMEDKNKVEILAWEL